MRMRLLLLVVLLLAPEVGTAGPNSGGVLLLHARTELTYTSGGSFCGSSDVALCDSVRVSVPADTSQPCLFYVLAAFPESASPRLKALSFGLYYDSEDLDIFDYGLCADFEISDNGWPAPSTGNGLSWTSVQTTRITEVCWAAAYLVSAAHPTTLELIPHPTQGGWFVDDDSPPAEDQIQDYGTLGFGTAGYRPCPSGLLGGDSAGSEGEEELPPPEAPEDPDSVTCTFPMRGEITPGNLLIHFDGRVSHFFESGTVVFDWAPNDSFRVNGVPLVPYRPYDSISEEELMLLFGRVPLVQDLIRSGTPVRAATKAFTDSTEALSVALNNLWQAGLQAGRLPDDVIREVRDAAARHPLVDPIYVSHTVYPPSIREDHTEHRAELTLRFWGQGQSGILLSSDPARPYVPTLMTREDACGHAAYFLRTLARRDSSAILLTPGCGYMGGHRSRVTRAFEENPRYNRRAQ